MSERHYYATVAMAYRPGNVSSVTRFIEASSFDEARGDAVRMIQVLRPKSEGWKSYEIGKPMRLCKPEHYIGEEG